MKLKSIPPRLILGNGLAALGLFTASLPAATFTWDGDTIATGVQDGGGTWNAGNSNWWNGATNSPLETPIALTGGTITSGTASLVVASVAGLSVGQSISGPTLPPGTTILAINPGTNTLTLSQNADANGTNQAYTAGASDVIFGAGSGTAGTISVTGIQTINSLTSNAPGIDNYVLDGGSIIIGANNGRGRVTINHSITIQNAVELRNFATFNVASGQTVSLGSTSTAANSNQNFLNSGNNVPSISGGGTVELTAGRFTATAAGNLIGNGTLALRGTSYLLSNSLQVGWSNSGTVNGALLLDSADATVQINGQLTVGRNFGGTGNGTVTLNNGFLWSNHTAADASALIGRTGTGIMEVNGGRFDALGNGTGGGGRVVINANGNATSSSGRLTINGGVTRIADLVLNGGNQIAETATAGTATLELKGGSLYIGGSSTIGAGSLRQVGTGTSTYLVDLSGGTLGANADWTSSVDITLSSGNTNLKAANNENTAYNITLSGKLTGNGGFTKTGGGILTLNAAVSNDYSGGTTIAAGTLVAATAGSLGSGNVNVGLATLTLQSADAIASTASLLFDGAGTIHLDYAGTQTLASITNTSESITLTTGSSLTAAELNSLLNTSAFTGSGLITIVIPEPGSASLLCVGIGALALARKRRSR